MFYTNIIITQLFCMLHNKLVKINTTKIKIKALMYIKRKIFFTIELIVISCHFFLVNDDTTFCYNVLKVSHITIFFKWN